jgi:hypothetical protein
MGSEVTEFKRQNVWALIGLTIITGTIYWAFWLRRQSRILNVKLPAHPIPEWFFPVVLSLTILNLGWGIPEALTHDAEVVILIGKIVHLVDVTFSLVWVFKVRNRLNVLLETSKNDKTSFGAVWTLILGVLYLQYRLNRLQRHTTRET